MPQPFLAESRRKNMLLTWIVPETSLAVQKNSKLWQERLKAPRTAGDYFSLAIALEDLGKKKQMETMLRRALEKNMNYSPALYGLALLCFQRHQEKDGKKWFNRALRQDTELQRNALEFQRQLRFSLSSYDDIARIGLWCLQELERECPENHQLLFQIGKILFEQNQFERAVPYLKRVLKVDEIHQEVAEYLSYIYERLYKGDQLIQKTLELAREVEMKSDLFFNLAMVCQHEQKRMDLALHFFYLASREEPLDPGLKFSLEQACLEVISQPSRKSLNDKAEQAFLMMLAHLYQGSVGVAKRYAEVVQQEWQWKFPDSFGNMEPTGLWKEWLLKDRGPLGDALRIWFSDSQDSSKVRSIKRKSSSSIDG